jgi:hypothetical protein
VTPKAIAAVEAIVKENRRVTENEIDALLDMSHGSAHHIVHDLKFHKYLIFNKYLRFSFDSPSYDEADSILCATDLLTSLKEVYF